MTRFVFSPTGFFFNSLSIPIPKLKSAAIASFKNVSYVIEFSMIVFIIISSSHLNYRILSMKRKVIV